MTGQRHLLQTRILDEIAVAFGLPRKSHWGWLVAPLFWWPTARFARVADSFDQAVAQGGISVGAQRVLPDFSLEVSVRGGETMPQQGPLLVVSNHPGAYDSLAIMASIPRRDLAVVLSDVPFLRTLNAARFFIFVPPDTTGRAEALRVAIRWLKQGGALLIFAHGQVEPDPAWMPGADLSIQDWSRSIEALLRKAPETCLQLCIASNVLLSRFVHSPLVKIRHQPFARQKLAEFLQVATQMIAPARVKVFPKLSFGKPLGLADLSNTALMPAVIQQARQLLQEHIAAFHQSDLGR